MTPDKIVILSEHTLNHSSKRELIAIVLSLREELNRTQEKLAEKEIELQKLIKKDINQAVNQPSSKQPEYHNSTDANKKRRTRKRKKIENITKAESVLVTDLNQSLMLFM